MSALKVGTPICGKGLVVNIADDMCLRPQNDVSALNRTFNFPINNDAFGCNRTAICAPREITRDVQWSSPSICPLTSTKPSAVTLPTIFSALAITVFSF